LLKRWSKQWPLRVAGGQGSVTLNGLVCDTQGEDGQPENAAGYPGFSEITGGGAMSKKPAKPNAAKAAAAVWKAAWDTVVMAWVAAGVAAGVAVVAADVWIAAAAVWKAVP